MQKNIVSLGRKIFMPEQCPTATSLGKARAVFNIPLAINTNSAFNIVKNF
jgi:hypothetical protein